MSSLQKPLESNKSNQSAIYPGVSTRPASSMYGRNAITVSTKAKQIPKDLPCKIGDNRIAITSARDYFYSKIGEPPVAGVKTPQGTSKFERNAAFFQTVRHEYALLGMCHSSRNAFSQLTNDRFLDLDTLCRATLKEGQASAFKMNTSATNIEHDEWREPPNLTCQSTKASSAFACTFWLSTQAYNEDLQECLNVYTCVLAGELVLPYLTVDFRKEQEQMEETRRRAAYIGTQALFNRHRLHMMTQKEIPTDSRTRDYSLSCHFMIIFDKAIYEVWEITADKDDEWIDKGCTMKRILRSTLYAAASVKHLYTWVCEIHYWAATKYGPACVEEIRTWSKEDQAKEDQAGALTMEEDQQGTQPGDEPS